MWRTKDLKAENSMDEPLCCSTETITKLLISYTPIHSKKFKRKKINTCKGEGNKEHNLVMSKILYIKIKVLFRKKAL